MTENTIPPRLTTFLFYAALTSSLLLVVSDAEAGTPQEFRGAPIQGFDVIHSFPHDPQAYTQGLEIHDGRLYEGTGKFRQSTLRLVDLNTGQVLKKVDLPELQFGEGITIFGDRIYQLTWRSGVGHIYDLDTFEEIGQFQYNGEGWGLTHDDHNLIMSDGTDKLTWLDPETMNAVHTISVWDAAGPVTGLNELEFINGELFANVFTTDLIARINPESGQVTAWVYLAGLLDEKPPTGRPDVLNGIAYDHDSGVLYVTGKLWPRLYEIEIIEHPE